MPSNSWRLSQPCLSAIVRSIKKQSASRAPNQVRESTLRRTRAAVGGLRRHLRDVSTSTAANVLRSSCLGSDRHKRRKRASGSAPRQPREAVFIDTVLQKTRPKQSPNPSRGARQHYLWWEPNPTLQRHFTRSPSTTHTPTRTEGSCAFCDSLLHADVIFKRQSNVHAPAAHPKQPSAATPVCPPRRARSCGRGWPRRGSPRRPSPLRPSCSAAAAAAARRRPLQAARVALDRGRQGRAQAPGGRAFGAHGPAQLRHHHANPDEALKKAVAQAMRLLAGAAGRGRRTTRERAERTWWPRPCGCGGRRRRPLRVRGGRRARGASPLGVRGRVVRVAGVMAAQGAWQRLARLMRHTCLTCAAYQPGEEHGKVPMGVLFSGLLGIEKFRILPVF